MLYPFTSRWLDDLHYLDEGSGRPIVLMHGNPTWSFLYRKLIPLLKAGGLRCIAPDLPGHGLSKLRDDCSAAAHAAAIARLIHHLDLHDYVLLGQDWGGPIGLSAAAEAPHRVGGVALGYTFAWPNDSFLVWFTAKVMGSRWGQAKIASGAFVPWVMRALLRNKPTDEEMKQWTIVEDRRSYQILPRELLNRPWLSQLEANVRERLGGKPALLFHGGPGEWLLGRATRRFARLFPHHQIVPLGRAGHYFQEDTPEPVAAALLRFAGTPSAPPAAHGHSNHAGEAV